MYSVNKITTDSLFYLARYDQAGCKTDTFYDD